MLIEDFKTPAFQEDFNISFTPESDLDIKYAYLKGNLHFIEGVLSVDLTSVQAVIVKNKEEKVKFEALKLISSHLKEDFENELKKEYLRLSE